MLKRNDFWVRVGGWVKFGSTMCVVSGFGGVNGGGDGI